MACLGLLLFAIICPTDAFLVDLLAARRVRAACTSSSLCLFSLPVTGFLRGESTPRDREARLCLLLSCPCFLPVTSTVFSSGGSLSVGGQAVSRLPPSLCGFLWASAVRVYGEAGLGADVTQSAPSLLEQHVWLTVGVGGESCFPNVNNLYLLIEIYFNFWHCCSS